MLRALTLACGLLALPAHSETTNLTIAPVRYEAGASVSFDGPSMTDLFMAGNVVSVTAPVGGSAHLAGRRVSVDAAVAGDLFAVGYSVAVTAPVGGDVSASGYELSLAPVTGNLRAAGSEVTVAAVGGYALITGADITLQGVIAGDAVLVADDIVFGPEAKVAGALTCVVGGTAVWWQFSTDIAAARERVAQDSSLIDTTRGLIEYQAAGEGPVLLAVHGSGGGFDQGMAFAAPPLAPKASASWRCRASVTFARRCRPMDQPRRRPTPLSA